MANATTHVQSGTVPWGDDKIRRGLAATAAIYYPGAMIALDASMNAVKCDNTAGLRFDGINADTVRTQVFTGEAAGDRKVLVERPWRFSMAIASAAATDIGRAVYAVDDQTVGYSTSNSILVGWVDAVLSATSVLIMPRWAGRDGTAGFTGTALTFTGSTGGNTVVIPDNLADGLSFVEGSNSYLTFITTDGSEETALKAPAATSVTSAGGRITATGGIGGATSGAGGAILLTGGAGTTDAAGGAVTLTAGAANGTGVGGVSTLKGGAGGATGAGGAALVTGGAGGATSGLGGAVTITAGAGTNGNAAGGVAGMTGGAGQGSAAGGVSKIVGGLGGATGAGGAALVTGGAGGSSSGTGGAVTIAAGAGTAGNAVGGSVTINGGALNGGGTNGTVTIQSAYAPVAGGGTSAAVLCTSTALLGIYWGSGAPTFSAAKGSLYCKVDAASAATRLYISSDAVGTWTAFTAAA